MRSRWRSDASKNCAPTKRAGSAWTKWTTFALSERLDEGIHMDQRKTSPRWIIQVHPAAADDLARLPDDDYRRVRSRLKQLEEDPLEPRAGKDVKKLKDLRDGSGLYRLRVGEHRAVYAVVTVERQVLVLVFEKREAGYDRLIKTAEARYG
jgi:mRNA-degrading endonuclease RelE of RelBE toxin-antitoxin system